MSRFTALLVLATLAGCSLDYDAARLSEELDAAIPDTLLIEFTQTIVSDGAPRFIVSAEQASTFVEQKRQYLDAIAFEELSPEGERITFGTADTAIVETDTENITLTGSLEFYSAEQDAWLTAESLFWDSEARTLTSPDGEQVVLRRGDDTEVQGGGFSADLARSTVRFQDGFSGTIREEAEE